jgi:hypothetical protein
MPTTPPFDDRGGVDAHAPLALVVGLVVGHLRGREAQRVERPDQVDPDDDLEGLRLMRAALGDRALGPADARAVDRDPQAVAVLGRRRDRRLDLVGLGHVGRDEAGGVAQLGGERLALLGVDVGDGDAGALGLQAAARRLAQARGAAHDEGSGSFDAHGGATYRTALPPGVIPTMTTPGFRMAA